MLFSYLDRFGEPEFRTHVFLRASSKRLRDALEKRGVAHTTTHNFSERVVRTTLHPGDLYHFARSFARVRRELIDLVTHTQADILHSISYPSALYTALAARATGLPHIWHEHNVKRIHAANRPIYRFAAAGCSYVIGPSNAVTSALARAGIAPPRLRTVYNGINLDRFKADEVGARRVRREFQLTADQPAIGLFGQLLPYKGHRTLIEAAPEILRAYPSARFFIVGALENPPYEVELQNQIAAAGLSNAFVFTGWRSDMHDVIGAMDMTVVPTLTPEPAALSLMETMALGRPLIASRVGGTPELAPDGEVGRLFAPGRADELAGCVVDFLRNPENAQRLAAAGRRRMEERFSEERHLDEMKQLYRRSVAVVGRSGDAFASTA